MESNFVEQTNHKRTILYQQPFLYGDFIPLRFIVNLEKFQSELKKFDNNWVIYNRNKGDTGRLGLSVTSLDGEMTGVPDLQSLYEHAQTTGQSFSENQFNKPTAAFRHLTSLHEVLNYFEGGLGRCRVIKFRAGGFFPPHRDQSINFQIPDYFRIFIPLSGTGENQLYFIYEDRKIFYEPGRAYLFNALKPHSVFSMVDNACTFAMSLQLNHRNVELAIKSFLIK